MSICKCHLCVERFIDLRHLCFGIAIILGLISKYKFVKNYLISFCFNSDKFTGFDTCVRREVKMALNPISELELKCFLQDRDSLCDLWTS